MTNLLPTLVMATMICLASSTENATESSESEQATPKTNTADITEAVLSTSYSYNPDDRKKRFSFDLFGDSGENLQSKGGLLMDMGRGGGLFGGNRRTFDLFGNPRNMGNMIGSLVNKGVRMNTGNIFNKGNSNEGNDDFLSSLFNKGNSNRNQNTDFFGSLFNKGSNEMNNNQGGLFNKGSANQNTDFLGSLFNKGSNEINNNQGGLFDKGSNEMNNNQGGLFNKGSNTRRTSTYPTHGNSNERDHFIVAPLSMGYSNERDNHMTSIFTKGDSNESGDDGNFLASLFNKGTNNNNNNNNNRKGDDGDLFGSLFNKGDSNERGGLMPSLFNKGDSRERGDGGDFFGSLFNKGSSMNTAMTYPLLRPSSDEIGGLGFFGKGMNNQRRFDSQERHREEDEDLEKFFDLIRILKHLKRKFWRKLFNKDT